MPLPQFIWVSIFAIGAIQGLFLSGVLWHLREARAVPVRILAALVLCFALVIGEELIDVAGLYNAVPHALLATVSVPLLIGPLLFLYVHLITQQRRSLRRIDYLHFLPFVLGTIYFLPFYQQSGSQKLSMIGEEAYVTQIVVLALVKIPHLFIYLVLALHRVRRHLKQDRQHPLPREVSRQLRGCRFILHVFLLAFGATFVVESLMMGGVNLPLDGDQTGSLFFAFLIYTFAFIAIKHPLGSREETLVTPLLPERPADAIGRAKYQTSPLKERQKKAYQDRLLRHMEAHNPYLDPDIRLDDIATSLSMSPYHLSQTMNELLGVNFYAFVNTYRVEEAKRKLSDPEHFHKTVLEIAFDSGFNSKATFNRIFKQHTGQTPTQYKTRHEAVVAGNDVLGVSIRRMSR